jgi:phosphomannomutase/phosphoglucomutase
MSKINPEIFRGYDIRGIVGQDLTPQIMEQIGRGYGAFLQKRRIYSSIVGYDCRLTSPEFSKSFIAGLRRSGINVIDIGLSLVQMMYWAQYRFCSNGGAFISASHNPKEYNGIKLAVGFSNTMVTDEVQELLKICQKQEFVSGSGTMRKIDVSREYFVDLLKKVKIKKGFKAVVDPSNSTPGKFVPRLLRMVGAEVIEQNCKLDGNFPSGTPDPTERIIAERLATRVIAEKADLGFSFDSDGDRIGIVDDAGTVIWNDVIVAMFSEDIIESQPGAKIIYNALCSKMVEEVIAKAGGKPIMWLTGHSFIKEKVAIERAAFGGELSGHFFFAHNFFGHDDGCYAALRVLELMTRKNQKLSTILEKMPKYISSPEIKIGCPDNLKIRVINRLKKDYPTGKICDIDGARLDFSDKMIIIRASQNGPYLTIKFESKEQNDYDKIKKYLYELLKSEKSIDWSFGINVESLK